MTDFSSSVITSEKVEVFIERLRCPECGEELESGTVYYGANPPIYSYKCPKCNYTTTSFELYPKVVYKQIKENN